VNPGAESVTETPPALAAGVRLGEGGRYEIRRRIGIGGMAEVYKGIDTRLGNRVVAIKTLSASVGQHAFADRMRRLFVQEAQALSRIKDENVVDVLDVGVAADGTPYMVMEFLHGTELGVFLKQNRQLSIDHAADVMLGVCAGVHACHMAGIIHRDLKPANIFLARTLKGELAKVLDFSVAKVPGARAAGTADPMKTDLIVGTPSYMSPEQAVGKPANELSDQYSIGALLYRCLTGRAPHGVLPRPSELRPEIPAELEVVMLRALESKPEKRFATVHRLGKDLLSFASSSGRERWRPYYRTPPLPIDPTRTGSLQPKASSPAFPSLASESASVPSLAPATVAPHHGLTAHEPTTSLDLEAQRGEVPEAAHPTKPTVVAEVVTRSKWTTSASDAVTAIDVHVSDANAPSVGERMSSASVAHARRRFMAVFAAMALIVLAVTVAGVRSVSREHDPAPVPSAPEWTRTAPSTPAQPPSPAPVRVGEPPAPSPTAKEPPAAVVSGRERSAAEAVAPRPKRRHRSTTRTDSIQYGADGFPILR
jgi:serine/threonine-protein kinase